MAGGLIVALAALAQPAAAGCSASGSSQTCSGNNIQHIYKTDGSVTDVTYENVTGNINANHGKGWNYVLNLQDTGGSGHSYSENGHHPENGQSGGDGTDGARLGVTMHFDKGYGFQSSAGGIYLHSTGGNGGRGNEDLRFWGTRAHGGTGGAGGAGGDISISASEDGGGKTPHGIVAKSYPGIVAISEGGEGGDGGLGKQSGSAHGYGGTGGEGGAGGDIIVELDDGHYVDVTTKRSSTSRSGIHLQSIGGTGSRGGDGNASGTAYGGTGGAGGDGGDITFDASDSKNSITTSGKAIHGIYAQSKGGNGGTGGIGSSGMGTGHGGDGGQGGQGGAVSLTYSGSVSTSGDAALGLYAMSAGGGGGAGGAGGGGWSGSGGGAEGAGDGGTVTLRLSDATVSTEGAESIGILLQSVGGFASSAGKGSGVEGYGASDQSGGDGGEVKADVADTHVSTQGDYAAALIALSSGGGGGTGSTADAFDALGSSGSAGGDGGTVMLDFTGTNSLTTQADYAPGVLALSVGGGGGVGGGADGIIALGGTGGSGGDGGQVAVTIGGDTTIGTSGDYGIGLVAASIGNGGGVAGSTSGAWQSGGNGGGGGDGALASLDLLEGLLKVTTTGDMSYGVVVASNGGGGGVGGSTRADIDVFVPMTGSAGGGGGNGDAVTVSLADSSDGVDISTEGVESDGFVAQSVGGGGGLGGSVTDNDIITTFNSKAGTGGGTGGDGSTVDVTLAGSITTSGASSTGILVQSVGNGGGSAGHYHTTSVADLSFGVNVGASGGSGGNGDTVTLETSVTVSTYGDHSDGILVQSIGGGGGDSSAVTDLETAGVNLDNGVRTGATGGDGGDGGEVHLANTGDILTQGDNSNGILAQSTGGGGGKGGATHNLNYGSIPLGAATLGAGGGVGGTAATVEVANSGDIVTSGNNSRGLMAQSTGGGGGIAGTTLNLDVTAASIDGTVGGSGGSGNASDLVGVVNEGDILTYGSAAAAIWAQSIGGGGGLGEFTFSGSVDVASMSISVGSDGGDGGSGGDVIIANAGDLETNDDNSEGIFAQSQGGAGGKAGLIADAQTNAGEISGDISMTVGGTGGKGGTAGLVDVANAGTIRTSGYQSYGIYAQSTGGDGGTGGAVYAATVNVGADGTLSLDVTVGGDGGDSGTGGAVLVENLDGADITTEGHYSDAIYAQSVGGNGGNGGGSYAFYAAATTGANLSSTISVGGSGGTGATGGDVGVLNAADLYTSGGNSNGIFAQSIGGNGGAGSYGIAYIGEFAAEDDDYLNGGFNTYVGGSGGTGTDAGTVEVINSGNITTMQDTSYGIYAQSTGGGGGSGGNAGAYTLGYTQDSGADVEQKGFTLNYTMGGSGGGSGDGNTVTVEHGSGAISTSGTASYGIFAQSVGGGGGTGGNGEPGIEGWLADVYDVYEKVNSVKEVYELVKELPGSLLESWTINVGGSGGASGKGGNVSVSNGGTIRTSGDSGTAIFAQSIGGGGGSGGDGAQGLLTSLTVAGSDSGGGKGGDIDVSSTGAITTAGDGAMGIFAQTVGGGGGSAGDIEGSVVTELVDLLETFGALVAQKADGAKGGNGGDVAITVGAAGSITTGGQDAHGIWAQSVGGGGGAQGEISSGMAEDGVNAGIGSTGADGNAGYVNIAVDGAITTTGAGAHGIVAMSSSGGTTDNSYEDPDTDSSSDYYSGGIKIEVGGQVRAEGADTRAILAVVEETGSKDPKGNDTAHGSCQQADSDCRGTSHIYVDAGATVETTNTDTKEGFETIAVLGGRASYNSNGSLKYSNMIWNAGTIRSASASAYVIRNRGGAIRIHNEDGGLLSGSIELDDDYRAELNNYTGATFAAGATVDLGKLGHYSGQKGAVISPWGAGTVGSTAFSLGGSFAEAGTYQVDMAQDASSGDVTSDSIAFNGLGKTPEVSFTGKIAPNWTGKTSLANGGSGKVQILSFANGATLDSLSASLTSSVQDSATVTYKTANGTDKDGNATVSLSYSVDYSGAASGVTLSDTALGYASFFNDVMVAGAAGTTDARTSDAFGTLATGLLNVASGAELEDLYLEHVPEENLLGPKQALLASQALHGVLQSCPVLDPGAGMDFLHQQDCTWGQVISTNRHMDAHDGSPGYDSRSWGLALAAQRMVAEDTFLEIGGQIEDVSISGDNFAQSGPRASFGAALKREFGALTVSGALGYGVYDLDYDRSYWGGDDRHLASSDLSGRFLSAELRASGVFAGAGGFYAKPAAALQVTRVWQDGFVEDGSGDHNWAVDGVTQDAVTLTPMVEIGRVFAMGGGWGQAYLRAGVTGYLTDPGTETSAVLADADAGAGTLNAALENDRFQGDLSLGLRLPVSPRTTLALRADLALTENSEAYGGLAKIEFRF
ncbi:hypothetical protein [Marinibacterium sp. SX1]|uniref:hypothetical protein n=1 Tax=Marinibacterium sp. SX1 TaxID=3388424 RepID=UPI003D170B60